VQPSRARAFGQVDEAADVEIRLEQPVIVDASKAPLAAAPTRPYARPDAPSAARNQPVERTLDPARLGDHLDRLYRAAWALCGSREDAEDLVQETYARMLARPRLLRNEDDLGYLLRALRNTFLNQKRTESRRLRPGPLPDQLDLVAAPRARQPLAALVAGELYAAIAALPADFRDVLVAVDITGLSYTEAARALRIREGTVMSRLYRARQQVVRRFEGG
jgi:RNA polymerase sigma-70 factor (ECF subfamily)